MALGLEVWLSTPPMGRYPALLSGGGGEGWRARRDSSSEPGSAQSGLKEGTSTQDTKSVPCWVGRFLSRGSGG